MMSRLTRRELLRFAGVGSSALVLAACQPKVVEKVVERTVVVTEEKVVQETVVVKEEVEKEVTRVVEKEVVAEPSPFPKMTLRFTYNGDKALYTDYIVNAFQSRHPNVEVTIEPIPAADFNQKIFAMAAGATLPDAGWTSDARVMPFAENKVSIDMRPLADADPEPLFSDVYPAMQALGEYNSGLYMVAWAADAPVMYFNKTMLQDAGVEPPPPEGWTVDEFLANLTKVAQPDKQIYGWYGNEDWWAIYVPWMEGFGGSFFNEDKSQVLINSPECVEACQKLADSYVKYNFAIPKGATLTGNPFLMGLAACFIQNRNVCRSIRDVNPEWEWDVCLPPRQPVKHVCGSGTMGTSVYTAAVKNKTEQVSWELCKSVIMPSVQRTLARGYLIIPVLQSMAQDASWYELDPPPHNRDVYLMVMERAITPPMPAGPECGTVYMGAINQAMADAWQEMVVGAVPAKEALDKAAKRINDCIASGGE
jgi:ABC-type glycerol-3-phosphate transport system substrate-binding protein